MKSDSQPEVRDLPKTSPWFGRLLRHCRALAATFAVGGMLTLTSTAQTAISWSSTTAGASWGTGGNWTGGAAPANSLTTNTALFNLATGITLNPNTTQSVAGITFGASAGAYTITRTSGGATALTLGASGIVNQGASNQTISGSKFSLALGAASTFAVNSTGNLVISNTTTTGVGLGGFGLALGGSSTGTGTISAVVGGTGSLTKNGTGTWTLSGTNTYSGSTTVTAGTLAATSSAPFGAATNNLYLNGGTLDLNLASATINAYPTTVTADSTVLSDRSATGAGLTYSLGALSIGSQTLTVSPGTTVNSGTAGVTFGTTSVTGNATFNVTNSANTSGLLTLGALNDSGTARTLTFSGTGTTTLGTAAASLVNGTTINVTGGTLNSNNATALSSLANVTLGSGATVNLGASQTFGSLNGAAGAVALGATTLTVGNTANNLSSAYGGSIGGSGVLIKDGTGTLALSGANSYSGGTTLKAGTLAIGNNASLGTGNLTITGGALDASAAGLTAANAVVFGSGATLGFTGTNSLTLGGGMTLTGSNTVNVAANDLTLSGVITGAAGSLTKTGAGTLIVSNAGNTYTGTTTISAGTLRSGNIVVSGGASGLGNATSAVVLGDATNTGTLDYTGNTATFTRGFTVNAGGGAINTATSGQTLTIATGNIAASGLLTIGGAGNTIVTSTITSTGALEKTGTGTLTLASGTANALSGITLTLGNLTVTGANTLVQCGPLSSANAANVLTIDSGSTVQAAFNSGSTTFAGILAGGGTFQKDGGGTLVFDTSFDAQAAGLSLVISGGTVALGNGVQIKVGTIHITGDTVLDFSGTAGTVLESGILIIDQGFTVTVNNWASGSDFWYATSQFYQGTTNLAAVRNTTGAAPQNQIRFGSGSGNWDAAATTWIQTPSPYGAFANNEIRPVPEPAAYGASLLAASLALVLWHRRRRQTTAKD